MECGVIELSLHYLAFTLILRRVIDVCNFSSRRFALNL